MSYPLVQAAGFHQNRRGPITWIVLHTTESDIDPDRIPDHGAEQTAAYFQGIHNVSSHYVVDDDSTVQCVQENDEAYTQAPWNPFSISIEQEGRALFDGVAWVNHHGGLLDQTAALVADLSVRRNIPLRFVASDDIVGSIKNLGVIGPPGITTHIELNHASRALGADWFATRGLLPAGYAQFTALTSHTDPGDAYPIDAVLDRARRRLGPVQPISSPEGKMLVLHAPVADNGQTAYARFLGEMVPAPNGNFVGMPCYWVQDPNLANVYKSWGIPERLIPVADFANVPLLGPVPHDDPVYDWSQFKFIRL